MATTESKSAAEYISGRGAFDNIPDATLATLWADWVENAPTPTREELMQEADLAARGRSGDGLADTISGGSMSQAWSHL